MMYDSIEERLNGRVLSRIGQIEEDVLNEEREKKRQVQMKKEEERKRIEKLKKTKEMKVKEAQAKEQREKDMKSKQLSEKIDGEFDDEDILGKRDGDVLEDEEHDPVGASLEILKKKKEQRGAFLAKILSIVLIERETRQTAYFRRPKQILKCRDTFSERRFNEQKYNLLSYSLNYWRKEIYQKYVDAVTEKRIVSGTKKQQILGLSVEEIVMKSSDLSFDDRDDEDGDYRRNRPKEKKFQILSLTRSYAFIYHKKKTATMHSILFNQRK